jgi:MoxR-like ATPase
MFSRVSLKGDRIAFSETSNSRAIISARQAVQAVKVEDNILDYLLSLVQRSRKHPDITLGASPRSAVAWLQTSKAQAWLAGRNYVTPDDVKVVASPLLRHRLILKPEAQLDGIQIDSVIASLLNQVSVPR